MFNWNNGGVSTYAFEEAAQVYEGQIMFVSADWSKCKDSVGVIDVREEDLPAIFAVYTAEYDGQSMFYKIKLENFKQK